MELNTIAKIVEALENPQGHEIFVEQNLRDAAMKPLERMLAFSDDLKNGKIKIA